MNPNLNYSSTSFLATPIPAELLHRSVRRENKPKVKASNLQKNATANHWECRHFLLFPSFHLIGGWQLCLFGLIISLVDRIACFLAGLDGLCWTFLSHKYLGEGESSPLLLLIFNKLKERMG
jgi:hypothetical protein